MTILRRILGRERQARWSKHSTFEGDRVYAVGDIHGRRDLLDELIEMIDADDHSRNPARIWRVFLGDFVNRGPDSKGVIDKLLLVKASYPNTIFLKGNHEEILLKAARGDRNAAALLHKVGGRETLMSYGVPLEDYEKADLNDLTCLVARNIPETHLYFLDSLTNTYVNGGYLFVHAGIRPGVPLAQQKDSDLRWIRREFLKARQGHEHMIIHGHSICTDVDERRNRIGIDTGAYATGKLTAIGLEGADKWYLHT